MNKGYNWKMADKLVKVLESLMKETLEGAGAELDLGNSVLLVDKHGDGYVAVLLNGDNVIHKVETDTIPNIVTEMISGGHIAPKCSACNDEHVEHLHDAMDGLEMSMGSKFLNDEDEKDPTGTSAIDVDTASDVDEESASLKGDEDVDHNDEEMIDEDSENDLNSMNDEDKALVDSLMRKHDTQQRPQIDKYPDGGYEVRIFGNNGLYYYYLVTIDHEVVHLATMGKSMKKQKWPTMEDVIKKSNPTFKNDFHFFENSEQKSEKIIKFLGVADNSNIIPMKEDYETGRGYNLTDTVRYAILEQAKNLPGTIDSITNNNDGTYKVVFEVYSGQVSGSLKPPTAKLVGFNFDRDGHATATDTSVLIMKSKPFGDFKYTHTAEELHKSHAVQVTLKEEAPKTKEPKLVGDDFFKSIDDKDLMSEHELMVMKSQSEVIRGHGGKKLNW